MERDIEDGRASFDRSAFEVSQLIIYGINRAIVTNKISLKYLLSRHSSYLMTSENFSRKRLYR